MPLQKKIDADQRVLILRSRSGYPTILREQRIANDALGRSRYLVMIEWEDRERVFEMITSTGDDDILDVKWSEVVETCRKLKGFQEVPLSYDGPVDQVPDGMLEPGPGEVVFWRPWKGRWQAFEAGPEPANDNESESGSGLLPDV